MRIDFSEADLWTQAFFPVSLGVEVKAVTFLGYNLMLTETKVKAKYRILVAC